jgi:SAM-dependent methyltransferase
LTPSEPPYRSRARDEEPWLQPWEDRVAREMRPGVRVLDVGSGRRPAIPPAQRPPGVSYVGLDLSTEELRAAPPGSYDELIEADIVTLQPELIGRFDLVVSWQVFEHVRPLADALENIRRYLVPGGLLVAQLSGRYSLFAIINQLVPHRVGVWAMQRFLNRDPKTVFPAHYDHCSYGALQRITSSWSQVEIVPRYRGSVYFSFFGPLQRAYLVYEDWAIRGGHRNLATHYLLSARR